MAPRDELWQRLLRESAREREGAVAELDDALGGAHAATRLEADAERHHGVDGGRVRRRRRREVRGQ